MDNDRRLGWSSLLPTRASSSPTPAWNATLASPIGPNLEGDFRDWAEIKAWALRIADALGSES
jgi:hypothetical protein